jgi:hypothetical protein
MKYIITHPGSAHKDDFLACSLIIAENAVAIHRRDPSEEEIGDPAVCVIDVGGHYDADALNFDHHQFPKDHPPTCALSLVLKHLGNYEDALKFCPWLETAEWLDARGPRQTAKWLNVDPFVVNQLSSPIDFSLQRYFAQEKTLEPDHPIWKIMQQIGADLLNYLRTLRKNLNALEGRVISWQIGELEVAYLPRIEGMPPETADALDMYVREQNREISATVSPDKRGTGFGLCRFNDDVRFDFTQIEEEEDVHFAHRQGFIAKTTAIDPERLKALLTQSLR